MIGLVSFFASCSNVDMSKQESAKPQTEESTTPQKEEGDKTQDEGEDVDYEEADAFNFGPGLGD